MRIFALDLSLTATGYATEDRLGVLTPPARHDRGVPRLCWIRDRVLELASGVDLVVLEGYSYASQGRAIVSLGELGGVIRLALHDAGLTWTAIAPTSRALYATGRLTGKRWKALAAVEWPLLTSSENQQP